MKSTFKLLAALLLALALGITASVTRSPLLLRAVAFLEPAGLLWIGFLKMVVVPLIVSLLISSVAGREKKQQAGALLKRTVLVFLGLYAVMLAVVLVAVPLLVQLVPASISFTANPADAAALAGARPLSFMDQLLSWVPENPFRSAAEGAILPLVVFSLIFGLALNRVADEQRATVVSFFTAVANAMLQIVEWVLVIAPLGVFCIVYPLATRMGAQVAGALGIYVAIHLVLAAACILLLYLLTPALTRTPVRRFVRACFPPQLIALGTQSSIATLPAMIKAAEQRLNLAPRVTNAVLPLAVSVFKMGNIAAHTVYLLFAARLYHIAFSPQQYVLLSVLVVALAVGSAGLPSGASFFAPVLTLFTAMGLPVAMVPVLFAMDTLPDMGTTVANVTADLAAVTIVGNGQTAGEEPPETGTMRVVVREEELERRD